MAARFVVVVVTGWLLAPLLVGSIGCPDPCVQLAERICNCEATADQRRACVVDRVTNQQSTVEISEPDREFCSDKLVTCTCAALDVNDLDACGFVPSEDDGEDGE